jgi:hypothetical protein
MTDKHEEYWERVAPRLRRHLGLHRPSIEEAQAAFDAAEEESLPKEELDSIIAFAKTGPAKQVPQKDKARWFDRLSFGPTQQEMALAFNRNAGSHDDEASRLMDELRQKALAEEDENEEEQHSVPDEGEQGGDNGQSRGGNS